jgi:hypothetical protein
VLHRMNAETMGNRGYYKKDRQRKIREIPGDQIHTHRWPAFCLTGVDVALGQPRGESSTMMAATSSHTSILATKPPRYSSMT